MHGDLQALWIDPADPGRMWQGSDGGLAFSWDAGATWQHVASISLGQFYHVSADDRKPFYDVSGGTQDNGTWTGPSRTREPSGILNDDWRMVSPIVGFNVLSDEADPDILLTQTPGGTVLRTDLRTRDQQSVGPQVRNYGGALASEMKVPLRMGSAAGEVAIRKIDHLLRGQRHFPIQQSGAELGVDQQGSDQGRPDKMEAVGRSGFHR